MYEKREESFHVPASGVLYCRTIDLFRQYPYHILYSSTLQPVECFMEQYVRHHFLRKERLVWRKAALTINYLDKGGGNRAIDPVTSAELWQSK